MSDQITETVDSESVDQPQVETEVDIKDIHFCYHKPFPDRAAGDAAALAENSGNALELFHVNRMAMTIARRWLNGSAIPVRFLNGTARQKELTQKYAKQWEAYANIRFVFNDSPDASVRVRFNNDGSDPGSWAALGTDAVLFPKDQQTVNFGWLYDDTREAEWQRVVMHEFAHILGCDHEDQQPAAAIQWDRNAVYRYFGGPPNNWTRQMIDDNILNRISEAGVAHTVFDPLSIMAYSIPAEFTLNRVAIVGGSVPSIFDKLFMGQMYPPPVVGPQPDTGVALKPDGKSVHFKGTANDRSLFKLDIPYAGKVRIWTSSPNANLGIGNANGTLKPVESHLQTVSSWFPKGTYDVTVLNHHSGEYDIVSRYKSV